MEEKEPSCVSKCRLNERMIIFIDSRNIKTSEEDYNRTHKPSFQFGYKQMMDFFSKRFHVVRGYFYDAAPHITQQSAGKKIFLIISGG